LGYELGSPVWNAARNSKHESLPAKSFVLFRVTFILIINDGIQEFSRVQMVKTFHQEHLNYFCGVDGRKINVMLLK